MKKTIGENLGKENLDTCSSQGRYIDSCSLETLNLTDRDAKHTLHGEYRARAIVPHHLRHHQHVAAPGFRGKIAPQLAAIGSLSEQVKFIVEILVKLSHHLSGLESFAVC